MDDLEGRVVVVTGGASGIGRGMAVAFASAGMSVIVADIEEPPLHEAVATIRASGGQAAAVVCDVSSWESVVALRETTETIYGPVSVVCNNAGVGGSGPIADVSLATWEWCLGVNLWGVIYGCKAFLPGMLERGSGHIVNTASILGHLSSANLGPYNVSKHGTVALSETLFEEMAEGQTGVGVTCLCPGFVATNIMDSDRNRPERLLDDIESVTGPEDDARAAVREMIANALSPHIVGQQVVTAVRAGALYVFTDHQFDAMIAARHRDIEMRRTPGSRPHAFTKLIDG